jgi:hypothetical protein
MRAAVIGLVLICACAASRVPGALRGYDIVVEPKDLQSLEFADVMRHYGFHVRNNVRGGSRPTAALIYFLYSDPGPEQPTWLHVRLADTRSGAILGAGSVQLDSTVASTRARAIAAVNSLLAP